jgi:hypothetical protein
LGNHGSVSHRFAGRDDVRGSEQGEMEVGAANGDAGPQAPWCASIEPEKENE